MINPAQPRLVRAIGRWSLVALMLNSIIGSGIFGQPSLVAGLVGSASPIAYLVAAAGMGVVMACFAEVVSRFREAGGPYLYARVAFGRFVGIEIAWMTWLTRLSGAAAAANLFVNYLAGFYPYVKHVAPRLAALTLLVGLLAAANYRGVSVGVKLSNTFTVAKLLPLLVFTGLGLFSVQALNLTRGSSTGRGGWLDAILISIYAFGGFEAALLPMSEARDPRRDAPFALFTSLATVALLYILIQVIVVGVLPGAAQTDRPLAAAAFQFMHSPGVVFMTLGALLSVCGYLSSMTLNVPRLTFALAEYQDFPAFFAAVHPRFRTPHLSIVIFAVLTLLLAGAGSFRWNLILSAIARLFTYASTCLALIVLRKKRPAEETFRLPAGPGFAVLGFTFSVVLITRMGRLELLVLVGTVTVALINWLWARRNGPPMQI